MEEYNENKEHNCKKHNSDHWIKFALLLLALFLACYLAVYYVLDQMRHAYYIPSAPIENIDRIMREQDRLFNEMSAFPMHNSTMFAIKNPVETYKDEATDSYKMIINLKPFDNNPNNVKIKIDGNRVDVNAASEKTNKHSDKIYTFNQSFVLPEMIDEAKVTKEKIKHKYVITMPVESDKD